MPGRDSWRNSVLSRRPCFRSRGDNCSETVGAKLSRLLSWCPVRLFALEVGSLYKVDIAKMATEDVDSLAIKVALMGVGVGALLGPASKRALEDLRRTANLPGD